MKKNNIKNKKKGNFKLIFSYLKDEKLRIFLYIFLVCITYLPVLLSTFFWGYAIEALVNNLFNKFLIFLYKDYKDFQYQCKKVQDLSAE